MINHYKTCIIQTKHIVLSELYTHANSAEKDSLITVSKAYLLNTISTKVFPQWYGTAWDFNGTTRTPRSGKIACGYFVTTVLKDVGYNIPRVRWAQSASEVFIKKLSHKDDIKRFRNTPIFDIRVHLKESGNGLYVVGLDSHVGFILVENGDMKFVHSNYYQPEIGVMAEELDSENPLRDSQYRVIGKLFSDEMIINWLINYIY